MFRGEGWESSEKNANKGDVRLCSDIVRVMRANKALKLKSFFESFKPANSIELKVYDVTKYLVYVRN